MSHDAGPPIEVVKRSGARAAFEPDKLCRSLFRAAEALGRPEAFLARELADSVVYFLVTARGPSDGPPSTADLAATVEKVVRELGYPALARVYAEEGTARRRQLRRVSPAAPVAGPPEPGLTDVYPPEVVAAHRAGLLRLGGLAHADRLAAVVAPPAPTLSESLALAAEQSGGLIVVDGCEHRLSPHGDPDGHAADFAEALREWSAASGRRATVHLNAPPPTWAASRAGPLFAGTQTHPADDPAGRREFTLLLLEWLSDSRHAQPEIVWHLTETNWADDFHTLAFALDRLAFAFDRPRVPVWLGDGLDRDNPAVLLEVAADFGALAEQAHAGDRAAAFLQKVGPLARLSLTAARSKLDHLRRHGPEVVRAGFLAERAGLIVRAEGLVEATVALAGASGATELARQALGQLRSALERERPRGVAAVVVVAEPFAAENIQDACVLLSVAGPGGLRMRSGGDMAAVVRKVWATPDTRAAYFV